MDKFKFFKKSAEKKKELPEPAEAEREAERESRLEKIKNWQIKRAQLLKKIFISRTVDNAGNYIPGVDVMKMTIEGAIGKTLSRRELAGKERILYIVSSAMILGFYITHDPILRLGASATFDVVMAPRVFKDVTMKLAQIVPQFGSILEKGQELVFQNRDLAFKIFSEVATKVLPQIHF